MLITETPSELAERIFCSGRVLNTVDDNGQIIFEESEAFAIADGKIIGVGSDEEIQKLGDTRTEVVDLSGRVVMPGFIETHMHIAHYGSNLQQLDCRPTSTPSVQELKDAIAAAAQDRAPGEWIFGWGWDESRMAGTTAPDRWDLDDVAPRNPVKLTRTCGHMAVFNSQALELAGIDESAIDPDGGHMVRSSDGELTGLFQERALELIDTPADSPADIRQGLVMAQKELLARGITTVHDMSTQAEELRALTELSSADFNIRVRPWLWAIDSNGHLGTLESAIGSGITSGFGNDRLRIQGVKFMLDGSVGGRTAALTEPYINSDGAGILIRETSEVSDLLAKAVAHGLRVAIHGIGERAIDVALESLESLPLTNTEIAGLRNRIEHCGLPTSENLETMKDLGIIAASSVGFLYELGDSYLKNLGPERVSKAYPQRSFRQHGIVAPPNSDCPVTDPNPWNVVYAATQRTTLSGQFLGSQEAISLAEAIHSYTVQAALTSFEEGELGVIAAGSHADFVILDGDPERSESVLDIHPMATYVAGECVYETCT